jgi:UDPglucose 6-dehydrogenase
LGSLFVVFEPGPRPGAAEVLGDSIAYAKDAYAAIHGADAMVVLTEWKEFAALDLSRVKAALKYPIVLDGRNLYSPESMAKAGLNYFSVGRAPLQTVSAVTAPVKSAG